MTFRAYLVSIPEPSSTACTLNRPTSRWPSSSRQCTCRTCRPTGPLASGPPRTSATREDTGGTAARRRRWPARRPPWWPRRPSAGRSPRSADTWRRGPRSCSRPAWKTTLSTTSSRTVVDWRRTTTAHGESNVPVSGDGRASAKRVGPRWRIFRSRAKGDYGRNNQIQN